MINSIGKTQNVQKKTYIKNNKQQSLQKFNTASNVDQYVSTTKKKNNLSFKGKRYPSGYYSNWQIKTAKNIIDKSHSYSMGDFREDATPYTTGEDFSLADVVTTIWTGGRNHREKEDKIAEGRVNEMKRLISDIEKERLNDKHATGVEIRDNYTARKEEFENKKQEIKEKQIKPKFIDLISREKEGKDTDIPNCLMIEGKNPKLTQELIDWTGRNSNCRFIKINTNSNLMKELKNCQNHYEQTRERTLINIEGLSERLKPKSDALAGLKAIMCSISEDYHSTIIFSSTDPSKLDQIALQPHRVTRINANIKDLAEVLVDDAKKRLSLDRANKLPVTTINDLLTIYKPEAEKLESDSSDEKLQETINMLKKTGVNGNHLEILDKVEAPILDDGSSSGFEESRKSRNSRLPLKYRRPS